MTFPPFPRKEFRHCKWHLQTSRNCLRKGYGKSVWIFYRRNAPKQKQNLVDLEDANKVALTARVYPKINFA